MTAKIWGPRVKGRSAEEVIGKSREVMRILPSWPIVQFAELRVLRQSFVEPAHAYYCLAALSRRGVLDQAHRSSAEKLLFKFRSLLEAAILRSLEAHEDVDGILAEGCSKSFFGFSSKQGVSTRYPLLSCMPTRRCGSGCYAHDGRDRDLTQIFRGVVNYFVGLTYEKNQQRRKQILDLLRPSISHAVKEALIDGHRAQQTGFSRPPRIRLSHVGEMAATPIFTSALAETIKREFSEVECVLYTRHPKASQLDATHLIVNFTIEGSSDKRIEFAPLTSRIVSSAWNGEVSSLAEVNFLEHHVEKLTVANSLMNLCPVTVDHKKFPSCDSARCTKCFEPTSKG